MTTVALNINVHNFMRWTSVAIRIDNPHLSRAQCMKNALNELKMLRSFIRNKWREIKKNNPRVFNRSLFQDVAQRMAKV